MSEDINATIDRCAEARDARGLETCCNVLINRLRVSANEAINAMTECNRLRGENEGLSKANTAAHAATQDALVRVDALEHEIQALGWQLAAAVENERCAMLLLVSARARIAAAAAALVTP